MPITLTLPAELEKNLQARAAAQQISLAELIVDILASVVADDFPSLEEVVAEIRALPPHPAAIRPATGSLADLLENAPEDPEFDLQTWTQQWNAIEMEMKARDR